MARRRLDAMHTTRGLSALPPASGKLQSGRAALLSSRLCLFLGIVALIFVGLGQSVGPACAQDAAGSVTSVVGTASIKRAGKSIDVTVGMPVQVADQVVVSVGGKVTVTLSDGSVLEIGPSSTLVIDEQLLGQNGARASTRVHLLAGILRSVAKHGSGGSLPNFEVHTPNAIMAVRGTTFDTQYTRGAQRSGYGAATEFTDERTLVGTVGVRNAAGGEEVSVPAGFQTTVAGDLTPTSPQSITLQGIPWIGIEAFTITEPPPENEVNQPPPAPPLGNPALPPNVGVISPPPPPPPPPPLAPPSLPSFPR